MGSDKLVARLRKCNENMYTYDPDKEEAADRIEALERLIEQMASLLSVADFEDISDYHASLEVLKQCENI